MKYTEERNGSSVNINIEYRFKLPPEKSPEFGKCAALFLAFFFINAAFFITGLIKFVRIREYNFYNVLFFALILSLGILFTASAFFIMHRYIIIAVIRAGYDKMTPFFRTVSALLGERYASDGKFKEKVKKALDFGEAFKQTGFGQSPPWIIKKAAVFILNRIPFVDFIKNLSPDVNGKDAKAVSDAIYVKINDYIVNKLFPGNNIKGVFFLLPANITVQIILLLLLK